MASDENLSPCGYVVGPDGTFLLTGEMLQVFFWKERLNYSVFLYRGGGEQSDVAMRMGVVGLNSLCATIWGSVGFRGVAVSSDVIGIGHGEVLQINTFAFGILAVVGAFDRNKEGRA